MLSLLASPGELAAAGPFSVGLNIASLLSPDFLRFDAALPAPLRSRTILALSPADIVADARCFAFATGFARARGYRVLLRIEAAGLLGVLAPALPEFDHVAIAWSPTLPSECDDLLTEPERFVLTGCDTQEAIAWGLAGGIRLFTGPAASESRAGMMQAPRMRPPPC